MASAAKIGELFDVLERSDSLDSLLEFLTRNARFVLHFCAVIVDSIDRITEQCGDLRRVIYTESDQCKNTQLGIQFFVLLQLDTSVLLEQRIELIDEVRIEAQKGVIEHLIEVDQLLIDQIRF